MIFQPRNAEKPTQFACANPIVAAMGVRLKPALSRADQSAYCRGKKPDGPVSSIKRKNPH
jgi:hypothetical protein